MGAIDDFEKERQHRIECLGKDHQLKKQSNEWIEESMRKKYVYNFSFLGRPIIQYPQDMIAMQEIIWQVKPDLIIETGIAHGGSLVMSASMLELNSLSGGNEDARVIGVDIDIREHNYKAIVNHPMSKRITMIQGSSIESEVIDKVREYACESDKILVVLDSNHTHEHVLAELEAYAPLVSVGSYCIVYDTFVEDMSDDIFSNRPWGKGNNPKTAVWEYLRRLKEEGRRACNNDPLNLEIDKTIENKLQITAAPDGYLKRIF